MSDSKQSTGPTSGRITDISRQARSPDRVNVFLDGSFAFGMDAMHAFEEGLTVGTALSEERVATLKAADDISKATDAAVRLLGHRPRSVREIRNRLRQKGYEQTTIDAAVAKLDAWHYVDDADFARFWVENREAHKPRGRRLLEQELRQKGVERDIIQQTIEDADIDEFDTALELGRSKLRSYAGLEPPVVRRRLGAYLARRGFGYDVIKPVLDRLIGELDDDPDQP